MDKISKEFGDGLKIEVNLREVMPVIAFFTLMYFICTVCTFTDWYCDVDGSNIWNTVLWGTLLLIHVIAMLLIVYVVGKNEKK